MVILAREGASTQASTHPVVRPEPSPVGAKRNILSDGVSTLTLTRHRGAEGALSIGPSIDGSRHLLRGGACQQTIFSSVKAQSRRHRRQAQPQAEIVPSTPTNGRPAAGSRNLYTQFSATILRSAAPKSVIEM